MKYLTLLGLVMAAVLLLTQPPAHAQDCTSDTAPDELSGDEIVALYDCIKASLLEGYQSGDNEVAKEYRDWQAAAVRPAAPGPHGERLLMTFVNEVGYAEYVKFAEEGVNMPVGTVIAKESFKLSKGKVRRGPLFIMTKAEAGSVPDTMDWVYSGVQPNGKAMKFKQSFCHDCHIGFEDQDAMGYPDPDVRVGS